jgi:sec-independent protein translocase protein TatA
MCWRWSRHGHGYDRGQGRGAEHGELQRHDLLHGQRSNRYHCRLVRVRLIAMLAEIIGPELLVVLGIVVLLFGGSQLPKLAPSLGKAKTEFHKGRAEGDTGEDKTPMSDVPQQESAK